MLFRSSPNTDGIDLDSCRNVVVDNVNIEVADDHISIKSGENWEGFKFARASENIVIRHSYFGEGAGLALGSETAGGIRNVTFLNNTMEGSHYGPRMKSCPHSGYPVRDVEWNGLRMSNIKEALLFIDTAYRRCTNPNPNMPSSGFHDIRLRNIVSTGTPAVGSTHCEESDCTEFLFDSVYTDLHSAPIHFPDISGVSLQTRPLLLFSTPTL